MGEGDPKSLDVADGNFQCPTINSQQGFPAVGTCVRIRYRPLQLRPRVRDTPGFPRVGSAYIGPFLAYRTNQQRDKVDRDGSFCVRYNYPGLCWILLNFLGTILRNFILVSLLIRQVMQCGMVKIRMEQRGNEFIILLIFLQRAKVVFYYRQI